MKAEFRLKTYDSRTLDGFVKMLTDNGYKIELEKNDRVAMKATVTKNEPERKVVLIGVEI